VLSAKYIGKASPSEFFGGFSFPSELIGVLFMDFPFDGFQLHYI